MYVNNIVPFFPIIFFLFSCICISYSRLGLITWMRTHALRLGLVIQWHHHGLVGFVDIMHVNWFEHLS